MTRVLRMGPALGLDGPVRDVFGDDADPIAAVEHRAVAVWPDWPPIVWEGDARTFEFSFVSRMAVDMLGYPLERWIREPTFWADVVVHPDDRGDAIDYCTLATGKGFDHLFEYRAIAQDGRVLWLRDIVRVVLDASRRARALRGLMFDVTEELRDQPPDRLWAREPPWNHLRPG